ncbi:MAG: 1-(5-phosphoribosyl)-5-amino-4-imidazole-carboxylate carboxylase, partial [Firmicutes bacterium HGW-Firmicutes-13]
MDDKILADLLRQIKNGEVSVEEGIRLIRSPGYEDLGFARVDLHRSLRRGFPEVIYCPGKTIPQIISIAKSIWEHKQNILATRAGGNIYQGLKPHFPLAEYHRTARIITVQKEKIKACPGSILVTTAGTSDIPVAEEAAVTAEVMGCRVERLYDVGVAGLHRLLDSRDKLYEATLHIVVAGMEGALASVVGGLVSRPVIAVPTSIGYGASFEGLSALLAMLNSCASGVTVV